MTTREQNNNQPGSLDRSNNSGMGRKGKQNNFLKLNLPGLGLLRKFQQYTRLPQEPPAAAPHPLEEELGRLTGKIDNLLYRIEGQDQEVARGQEEEVGLASLHNLIVLLQCVVCGSNRASMQTLPCAHQVVCRKCFVRTIQMAVDQKRLPLRCIMCRAKVLKIRQDHRNKDGSAVQSEDKGTGLPKSVSGYNISNNISCSGSNYSFTSGVSAVSSESSSSRKCSLTRDFSFSSLSNFQNVNLLDKSQIPRSKSSGFGGRRSRRSRSPSPISGSRSKSAEGVPPIIKIERSPSDEWMFSPSPTSPATPVSPPDCQVRTGYPEKGSRSPRSPTSPTAPKSPSDGERIYSSRGSSRLSVSTPLSPIKESRKETGSLLDLHNSPVKENKLELASPPKKQSSRIRCAEKIVTQIERDASRQQSKSQKCGKEDVDMERTSVGKSGSVKLSKSVTFKDC